MGHPLLLLHPIPRRNESTGRFPRHDPLEGPFPAIYRLVWVCWVYDYHTRCRVSRVPEGELEFIRFRCIVYRNSDLYCADSWMEAVAQYEGEILFDANLVSSILTFSSLSVRLTSTFGPVVSRTEKFRHRSPRQIQFGDASWTGLYKFVLKSA